VPWTARLGGGVKGRAVRGRVSDAARRP
jgi:hypothetical protein